MAEQCGYREPVGKTAHHRGLRKSLNEADGWMKMDGGPCSEEQQRHRDQHAGCDDPHIAR